jgi:hypothetical protein
MIPKGIRETAMFYSTDTTPELANAQVRLAVLPHCDSETRCAHWLGALNGEKNRGCGINVLRFMSEIDDPTATQGLQTSLTRGPTTPGAFGEFSDMLRWFNHKLHSVGSDDYIMERHDVPIETKIEIKSYFDLLKDNMPNNSCTIVKLNRTDECMRRKNLHLTPGHYVLISKWSDGNLYTYEPLASSPGNCVKFPYKGTISDTFFNSYSSQCYMTASLLVVRYIGTAPAAPPPAPPPVINPKAAVEAEAKRIWIIDHPPGLPGQQAPADWEELPEFVKEMQIAEAAAEAEAKRKWIINYPGADWEELPKFVKERQIAYEAARINKVGPQAAAKGGNKNKAFIMPDDTMVNLITNIQNSIECENSGGKKKNMTNKRKSRKLKKSRKSRRVRKKKTNRLRK